MFSQRGENINTIIFDPAKFISNSKSRKQKQQQQGVTAENVKKKVVEQSYIMPFYFYLGVRMRRYTMQTNRLGNEVTDGCSQDDFTFYWDEENVAYIDRLS